MELQIADFRLQIDSNSHVAAGWSQISLTERRNQDKGTAEEDRCGLTLRLCAQQAAHSEAEHDPEPAVEDKLNSHQGAHGPQGGFWHVLIDHNAQQSAQRAAQQGPAPLWKAD